MRLVPLAAALLLASVSVPASAQNTSRSTEARARRDAATFEALRSTAADSRAQVRLAEMYLRGRGTPRDTVAAIAELGRAIENGGPGERAALTQLRRLTRGDRFRVVARQEVAPGIAVVTTSIPVLPTYWAGSACVASGGTVFGGDNTPTSWRIDRIVLERNGTARALDTLCMGQDWPVPGTGEYLPYRLGDEMAARVAGGWLIGTFSDGGGTYTLGWNLETGERRLMPLEN